MRKRALVRAGVLTAAAVLVAACDADRATSSSSAQAPSLLTVLMPGQGVQRVSALTRGRPLTQDIVVTATIGSAGGVITLPEAGLTVTVPVGAVTKPTTFTVTALKGAIVAYEFGPSGMKFPVPLQVTQSLKGTNAYLLSALWGLQGAYFADAKQLDQVKGEADVNEFEPTVVNPLGSYVQFTVSHFSGYIVASGCVR